MGVFSGQYLAQTATYWEAGATDVYDNPTFTKRLIACRWEERVEEITGRTGETIVSKAVIYVGEDISEQGYLKLGDHMAADDPFHVGAEEIKAFRKIPDLRNVRSERRVYL